MGNTTSNPPRPTIREASSSPSPGNPHPSLRTKKKSLELPDLASLSLAQNNTRGRSKTASIPIPTNKQNQLQHQTQRAPVHLPSTPDVSRHNFAAFPPAPRPNPAAPRGRQQPISARQQQNQVALMQELYNQSQQPTNPSPSRQFQQETVRSSIPIALTKALSNETPAAAEIVEQEYPQKEDLLADFVPVKIVWKGGGTHVVLARAGDNEWKGRKLMEKESTNVWTLTVMLRPGTHHVRFFVDGQWRVADDLPAAVDDQGSLANYVAVPFPVPAPAPTPTPTHTAPPALVTRDKLVPGQSFWSANSSADGETEHHRQPQEQQQQQQQQTSSHTSHSAHWTNILPPELIEAAREEEAYLSASAGQYEPSGNTRVTTGFVPAPSIPPAPGLPRHLEKLILNTRVGAGLPGVVGSGGSNAGARSGSGQAMGGVGVMGVGSGQGQAARKERRDRENHGDRERRDGDRRERDRDRERERGMRRRATTAGMNIPLPPPPPPPSEVGSSSWVSPGETMAAGSTPSLTPTISTNTTTTPQTSLPTTPVGAMSPVRTSPTMSPTKSPAIQHNAVLNTSTSSSANNSANTSAAPSPNPNALLNNNNPTSTPLPSAVLSLTSVPSLIHPSISGYLIPSGSRTITIDSTSMPSLSDDGSVLPVPSHVVLHHLSTSAIRNGVLAVGNTIRYRKKYLTTIYYKPT